MDLIKSHPGFWNMPGLENNLFKRELISYTEISPAGISNNSNSFKDSIFIVAGITGHKAGSGQPGLWLTLAELWGLVVVKTST